MFGIIGEILSDAAKTLVGDQKDNEVVLTWDSAESRRKENTEFVNRKIKALEEIEAETDPRIKKRMQIYYNEGIYDFSGIRNI